jgi:hypothetical protein
MRRPREQSLAGHAPLRSRVDDAGIGPPPAIYQLPVHGRPGRPRCTRHMQAARLVLGEVGGGVELDVGARPRHANPDRAVPRPDSGSRRRSDTRFRQRPRRTPAPHADRRPRDALARGGRGMRWRRGADDRRRQRRCWARAAPRRADRASALRRGRRQLRPVGQPVSPGDERPGATGSAGQHASRTLRGPGRAPHRFLVDHERRAPAPRQPHLRCTRSAPWTDVAMRTGQWPPAGRS